MLNTMEALIERNQHRTVVQYGDKVIEAFYRYLGKDRIGYQGFVYTLAEQPVPGHGPDARSFMECELNEHKRSDELFADAGTAFAWAIENA